MKDPDYIIRVEKAIAEKYGDETIQDPKGSWDVEKEKKYLEQIKKIACRTLTKERIEVHGVLVPKKLFIKDSRRTCPVCKIYSFKTRDDLYMSKFECCFKCYILHVEGREEKWLNQLNSQENS